MLSTRLRLSVVDGRLPLIAITVDVPASQVDVNIVAMIVDGTGCSTPEDSTDSPSRAIRRAGSWRPRPATGSAYLRVALQRHR